jgi:hypothetical protein
MQTFLPYDSFTESAKCLDYRRLGKQRVEAYQILRVLTGESKGWINHPAVKMWRGHEGALARYGLIMCQEWIARGYKDTCTEKIDSILNKVSYETEERFNNPSWFSGPIHASHRSNLLRKNKQFYSKYGWTEPDNLPYVWPSKEVAK